MGQAWQAWVLDGSGQALLRSGRGETAVEQLPGFRDARLALESAESIEWSGRDARHFACRLKDVVSGSPRIAVVSWRRHLPWLSDARLTPRQLEVCELAATGATAEEVARHLGISPHTVRQHLKMAYQELGVANRVELAQALGVL